MDIFNNFSLKSTVNILNEQDKLIEKTEEKINQLGEFKPEQLKFHRASDIECSINDGKIKFTTDLTKFIDFDIDNTNRTRIARVSFNTDNNKIHINNPGFSVQSFNENFIGTNVINNNMKFTGIRTNENDYRFDDLFHSLSEALYDNTRSYYFDASKPDGGIGTFESPYNSLNPINRILNITHCDNIFYITGTFNTEYTLLNKGDYVAILQGYNCTINQRMIIDGNKKFKINNIKFNQGIKINNYTELNHCTITTNSNYGVEGGGVINNCSVNSNQNVAVYGIDSINDSIITSGYIAIEGQHFGIHNSTITSEKDCIYCTGGCIVDNCTLNNTIYCTSQIHKINIKNTTITIGEADVGHEGINANHCNVKNCIITAGDSNNAFNAGGHGIIIHSSGLVDNCIVTAGSGPNYNGIGITGKCDVINSTITSTNGTNYDGYDINAKTIKNCILNGETNVKHIEPNTIFDNCVFNGKFHPLNDIKILCKNSNFPLAQHQLAFFGPGPIFIGNQFEIINDHNISDGKFYQNLLPHINDANILNKYGSDNHIL